jgi:putative thiamine transport system substrate-binding protein
VSASGAITQAQHFVHGGQAAHSLVPAETKASNVNLSRRHALAFAASFLAVPHGFAGDWAAIEAEAKGQTVYFNAWAGSETINAYIAWVADMVHAKYDINLNHVKIADAAEVVKRVRAEVEAGVKDGSVDLVWINGENFRAMKSERLLFGPFAESLPNFAFVDVENKPTTRIDFGEPVEGFESPWGMAQLTFFGDGAKIAKPPLSMTELVDFARDHPGRVTYPAPPDFHGTTFVKQALRESISDPRVLDSPATEAGFVPLAEKLGAYLDTLHPHLWREGKQFPPSQAQIVQMLSDGELVMGLTFNPTEPANLVATGKLPASTIAWQHAKGTTGNTHFVAIPINARVKAAAQVVANFLLSPEAQARKADVKVWGDPTVLKAENVSGAATIAFPAPTLPEPHASYVPLIEAFWLKRYGA